MVTCRVLWCLVGLAWVAPVRSAERQVLRGHVPAAVARLQPVNRLPGTKWLNLAIGLPWRNREALTNQLQQLYDPASPQYRRFLTPAQFTERFGPTPADYQALLDFARANGLKITATHPNRAVLDVRGTAADLERVFHVQLSTYDSPTEGRTFFAPDAEPSLDLAVPLLGISGLSDYFLPRPMLRAAARGTPGAPVRPQGGSGTGGAYLGQDFRAAYVPGVALTGAGETVGLLQFDGFHASDIAAYEDLAGLPHVPLTVVPINGGVATPGSENGEVCLDIEMVISMAPGISGVIVYEAPNPSPWVDLLSRMANDNLARQLSCSWGGGAPDPQAEAIFQQMAAQGQSFYNASGDSDAFTGTVLFPADSPNITQVGGTTLTTSGPGGSWVSETAWNRNNGTGTSGGVSPTYPIPSWQQGLSMVANQGSTAMRNIPDVALTGEAVYVKYNNGGWGTFGGTSCAAPLWAGFTALVNQQAAANGRPPVGFVNPAIYALGKGPGFAGAFHDTTTGNNSSSSSPNKYQAVAGYDLCTGWGTPTGQTLIDFLAGVDVLKIAPGTAFSAKGPVGGPFDITIQTCGLTNLGATPIAWTVANTASWLAVAPSAGTLAAGGASTNVNLTLTPTATNLAAGVYNATLWFTNLSDGIAQSRPATLAVTTPMVGLGPYALTVLSLGPVAYWPLNETNLPPAADVATNAGSLGSAATGFALSGVAKDQPGVVGTSFRFSNASLSATYFGSHVDVPFLPALNPSGPFTVELWAKPAQVTSDLFSPACAIDLSQNAGSSRSGWIIYQNAASGWQFRVGGLNGYAATNSGGTVQANAWHHLVGVYDGASVRLYVNGQLAAGPQPASGFSPNASVPLRLGATTIPNRAFDGWVDEVAFYTNALGADTIAGHYSAAVTDPAGYSALVLSAQPVGYWQLDEPVYNVPVPGTFPVAVNLGSLAPAANATYAPGAVPGVAGAPSAGFGLDNLACAFAGAGFIDVLGSEVNFTGPLTLTAWIKASPAAGVTQAILSRGGASYRLTFDGTGHARFASGSVSLAEVVSPASLDDGQWHFLAGVYDATHSQALFVDGTRVAVSTKTTVSAAPSSSDLWIGGNPDIGVFQYFNGAIDEVAVFTNALTAAQIGQLFRSSTNTLPLVPPVLGAVRLEAGAIRLSWSAVPGCGYQLQYKTDLTATNWIGLGGVETATNTVMSAADPCGPDPRRFYRVAAQP